MNIKQDPPKRGRLPGRVKAESEKLSVGRPRLEPPANAAKVIHDACAKSGSSKIAAAMALGVSRDVLARWFSEYPELQESFEQAKEKERASLHSVLYEAAMAGAVVPALFLLKARHGYREGEQEGQANRVSINFNIPGALPLDRYMVIDNEPNRTEPVPAKSAISARRS